MNSKLNGMCLGKLKETKPKKIGDKDRERQKEREIQKKSEIDNERARMRQRETFKEISVYTNLSGMAVH